MNSGCLYLFAYLCIHVRYGKKPFDHSNSLLADLCDSHKIPPNKEAHEEIVCLEKFNYGVISLGSKGFCF